ncbi:MAG: polysaccharide biosynthesis protein [Marmoricola sp.]|jgi:UDP-N-acetylglucosamine:LPS N-acetylglucosamine transferase|nr:polysaccharide biosynthesis protein [Marmoricola sp.]
MQMKVLLVCSSGGHLTQLMCLRPWWEEHERQWVTFDTDDAVSKLRDEDVVWAHHPTTRNLPNLARNTRLAWRTMSSFQPDLVVTTGAAVAVPFFWMHRKFHASTIYLEVFDRIDSPTLTGRLCRPATDLFLVQWPEQQELYRSSVLLGKVW